MTDRYYRVNAITAYGCTDCGAVVTYEATHDAFHDRLDRLRAAVLTQEGQDMAKVAEPECPFPMGSKVRLVEQGENDVYTVTGWFYSKYDDEWLVNVDNQTGMNGKTSGWLPSSLELVPDEPEPLSCAVCGEPVRWFAPSGNFADEGEVTHVIARQDHAATLIPPEASVTENVTLDEPPVGTPVWWDGKWWVQTPGDEPYYCQTDGCGLAEVWKDMPGAIPASIPKETRMSIQRYRTNHIDGDYGPVNDGELVLYADHVAAVGAEREQTRIRQGQSYINGYESGVAAERARIRQAVIDRCTTQHHSLCECMSEVLSIIDGEDK